jgi:LPXTG-motif cell wall-anchored protein
MKTLKSLAIAFCVSLFLLSTSIKKADDWNKETKVTFSGPVQIENTQLPAGTYVFKLADTLDRHIVQIFNEDQTQVIATIMAIPDYRLTPADKTVVKFSETSDGSEASGTLPESGVPIKEWFYPGDNSGLEFKVVSQPQIAAAQPEPVAAPTALPETSTAPPEAAAPIPAEPATPEAEAPAPEAQAPTAEAPAETPQAAPTESTPEQPAAPEQLPQTASQMPLLALMGIVSLAAAASFSFILKRWA